MNLSPANIKNIATSIRHKTHDYYWWKHNKSDEQINEINNTQVIAVKDLAEILAREFSSIDSEFNKEALTKTLTTNWSHL